MWKREGVGGLVGRGVGVATAKAAAGDSAGEHAPLPPFFHPAPPDGSPKDRPMTRPSGPARRQQRRDAGDGGSDWARTKRRRARL